MAKKAVKVTCFDVPRYKGPRVTITLTKPVPLAGETYAVGTQLSNVPTIVALNWERKGVATLDKKVI